MNKFWSNYALTFALIASLLVMPWTTTHVHLTDHHQHESISHQHQTNAHTHSLADQYVAPIDFSHSENHQYASDQELIEFVYEVSLSSRDKLKNPSFTVESPDFQVPRRPLRTSIKTPVSKQPVPGSLYHLSFNPRAPPQTS